MDSLPLHIAWMFLLCVLSALMYAGFAFYNSGLCRAKNTLHTVGMHLVAYGLCTIAFFSCGFAFLYGGMNCESEKGRWLISWHNWGLCGGRYFFPDHSLLLLALFLLMGMRASVATVLPIGALIERWRFKSFFIFSFVTSAVLCPIFSCWVWGGGWLAQLGSKMGWAHGAVDFSGSSVIHLQGGTIALVTAWQLGPRIGKFSPEGKPRPMLGHHMPASVLGIFLLAAGWFGLTVGSSLFASDGSMILVAVNTLLASAGGATAACVCVVLLYGKPDPSMICNGLIAGLVAIGAACAFVGTTAALAIGIIAGCLVVTSILFWERRGIDDPVGVVSVHGICGLWGTLALGLFANGRHGQGYNGVGPSHGVTGLFYGDSAQLICQLIMAAACIAWSLIAGGFTFWLIGVCLGTNRVRRDTEVMGLDVPELGVTAYPEFVNPTPNAIGNTYEPRPAYSPNMAGHRRYSVVIEGVDAANLIRVWSSLCQVRPEPASPQFKAVYFFLTTVKGNRFRFNGGEPDTIKDQLCSVFKEAIPNRSIVARLES